MGLLTECWVQAYDVQPVVAHPDASEAAADSGAAATLPVRDAAIYTPPSWSGIPEG